MHRTSPKSIVNVPEHELVSRCLSEDPDAQFEFVEKYQKMIYSLCYRMMGNREDAEDAAQESLIRALRGLATWDTSRQLKPWLLAIAANRCRTALSKRSRRPISVEFPLDPPVEDGHSERMDLAEELEIALSDLSPEHRECFLLFHQHQLSCAEVSEVTGRPEGTIKTWLHRIRKQLAEALCRRGIVPESNYGL
ncbi:MAG TPA: RNA polymerase sigma factor [Planctomycetaceae bacterium]|nr:RNA polymerase sigma factor [Planctomycetaceae bacterium]